MHWCVGVEAAIQQKVERWQFNKSGNSTKLEIKD